jgi:hypothetical protein
VVHAWEPAVRRASYAILGDGAASGQERLRAQSVLAAVMRGVYGSEIPPGTTAELAEGTAERVLVQRSTEASLLVLGAAGAHLAGRPAGPVIRACMRSARCPLVIITASADTTPPVVSTPVAVSPTATLAGGAARRGAHRRFGFSGGRPSVVSRRVNQPVAG